MCFILIIKRFCGFINLWHLMSIQSNMNVKFLSNLEMLSFLFLCDRGSQKRPARSPKFESLMLYLKIVPTFKPTVATQPRSQGLFPLPIPKPGKKPWERGWVATTSSTTSPQRQVFQNTKSFQVKSPLVSAGPPRQQPRPLQVWNFLLFVDFLLFLTSRKRSHEKKW